MTSPQTILTWLLGGTLGAAGIIQGLHWRATRAPAAVTELEKQLRSATEEIEMLKRENESLRSLAQGGGELSVPRELISRIEREFGLKFLSSPVVHRIAREELRDRIAAAIESRMGPSGIDDRREAWQLIGWLRPDDDLLTQLAAVKAVGASGWFDEVTGEAWMLDRTDLRNVPDQATLLRLLTRILFHQHFPPPPAHPGDDAARAREALHEGTAAGAEARFYAEKARNEGFMPMKENSAFKVLFASLPTFLQGLTTFPETEGKGFADSFYVKGNEALHTAFRNPPQTTRAVISPGETGVTDIAQPDGIDEPFLTESAGQLGLRLWLQALDEADASELAAAWRGDRYFLIPDGEESAAVLWDIELANADAADRFQEIARRNTVTAPEKRELSVVRLSSTRLRFLNTAEAETAKRLGTP